MLKPEKLKAGDTVAAVSLSAGMPAMYPDRYAAGKRQLEEAFDLSVEAMPNALREPEWLAQHPEARASDLHQAFADPKIKAVISTIGGEDSIRLLPYLDLPLLASNPKIFMGYSDTTVTHLALYKAGVRSFYGPSILAGFGENCGLHDYLVKGVQKALFDPVPPEFVENRAGWTDEFLDWGNAGNQSRQRQLNPPLPWRWLQGSGQVEGHLLGGCIDVLDWLRGTKVWPDSDEWKGAVIFIETSEEKISPHTFKRMLRAMAATGAFDRCAAVLSGRPGGGVPAGDFGKYDSELLSILRGDLGLSQVPIITQMDFGHTDPMMTMPYGMKVRIDCEARKIISLESAVTG